eukprot:TRINITY_DN47636_c0_g1_i1.p1 TRINITY_DN47636_c0_g1~~TRINITY_DN47636_c0_g1_i1.p1  ORF type:complete len:578 (-),score=116.71 TRINITY_DN47636_c0_g1_i1:191-1834(-)
MPFPAAIAAAAGSPGHAGSPGCVRGRHVGGTMQRPGASPLPRHEQLRRLQAEEELLDSRLAAARCRGLASGYVRSQVERGRALVVGCNYPRCRGFRLWGASADAHAWASTLSGCLGVPERNVELLTDEDTEGAPVNAFSSSFPSQTRILDGLRRLVQDSKPGDLIVFVFCGRGTLLLDKEKHAVFDIGGEDEEDDGNESDEVVEGGDSADAAQEGLLCGDFETADWQGGYSARVISSAVLADCWRALPAGCVLTIIADTEHGVSLLPVSRRLDSARLPQGLNLDAEPTPVLEALTFGVARSRAEARRAVAAEADAERLAAEGWEESNACAAGAAAARRSCNGCFPRRRWLPGRSLWGGTAADKEGDAASMDPEVIAFAFAAAGPGNPAFEAHLDDTAARRAQTGGSGGRRGPAGRRGLLTHCLLQALDDMNYQGSYYDMWWHALRVLRRTRLAGQQFFQLTFSDGADPTCREALAPVGAAEARAFARRAEMARHAIEDGTEASSHRSQPCCSVVGVEPVSARGEAAVLSCGCGATGPGGDAASCSVM